ncbi:ATP-binding protein [Halorutilales archaeon Cl-col2-1]
MVEERVSSQTGRSPTSDILLLLRNKSDIDLLRDELQTDHNVRTDSDIQSDLDLVILDVSTFEHRASRLREKKESEEPVFLPYLLVKREREEVPPGVWETVDDVVEIPVDKKQLDARIRNLLRNRRLSLNLGQKNRDLSRARDRLREAQEVADIGYWSLDLDSGRIELSEQAQMILGLRNSLVENYDTIRSCVHPDDRGRMGDEIDETVEKGYHETNYRILRNCGGAGNDDEVRIIHQRSNLKHEDGEPARILGTVQDVTEQRKLRTMLNSVRDITKGILDADSRKDVFDTVRDTLASRSEKGYRYGCTAIAILDDDNQVTEIYNAGSIADSETESERRWREIHTEEYIDEVLDSGTLTIDDITRPPYQQHDSEREGHGAIALALEYRDTAYGIMTLHLPSGISKNERRVVEEIAHNVSIGLYTIEARERIRTEKDQLALLNRIVRHDIRNDMNKVLGWGSKLRDHVDDEGEEYLDTVLDASQHVVDLTRTARDFVEAIERGNDVELKAVRLSDSVEDSVRKASERHSDAEIRVDDIPDVDVRANDLLSTVFRNLLNNAVQHNDKPTPRVEVSAEIDNVGGRIIVCVADNGPGIPDGRKQEVFGKGEKGLESEGTGVGLYLVNTLVESYGGDVWVEDNPDAPDGEGTVFVVELQAADKY